MIMAGMIMSTLPPEITAFLSRPLLFYTRLFLRMSITYVENTTLSWRTDYYKGSTRVLDVATRFVDVVWSTHR